jgi:hypothetical protein
MGWDVEEVLPSPREWDSALAASIDAGCAGCAGDTDDNKYKRPLIASHFSTGRTK